MSERSIYWMLTEIDEIEGDTSKWKDTSCTCIRGINMVTILTIPKAIYRFTVIFLKIPMHFSWKIGKELSCNSQGTMRGCKEPEQSCERTKMETPHFLILNDIIELQ